MSLEQMGLVLPSITLFTEGNRNLEYRTKAFDPDIKVTLKELFESGSQFFVDYLF